MLTLLSAIKKKKGNNLSTTETETSTALCYHHKVQMKNAFLLKQNRSCSSSVVTE